MSWQLDLLRNFNVGNIISGTFQFAEVERAESPNLVRATFIDAANRYQKSVMQAEDEPDQDVRGTVIQDMELLGVSSRDQAGRLAQMQLMKAALCRYVCSFRVSIYDCAVTCGDLCTVTHAAPGWTQKPFRIVKMIENQNDEIDITCEEYDLNVFGDAGQVGSYTEYPSEPNPVTVRPPTDVPDVHRIVFTADSGLTWTAGTIYYKGIGYEIDAGGTSDAYIYFDPSVSETELQTDASQPTLGANGWVLAYYDASGDEVYVTRIEKIIHGDLIKANTITTSTLNFVPLVSASGTGDIVATINASEEGIRIGAGKISISGSTDFTAGYDPTSKVAAVGGAYDSAASGARVRIFPDANTGIQVIDDAAADVFKVLVGGTDVGDVIIGDYDNDNGAKYDKNEGTFDVRGLLTASDIQSGGTITGSTLQTGATGQRFVVSASNLAEFYDSGDVKRVEINADAGYGYLSVYGDRFAGFGDQYTAVWGGQININKEAASTAAVFNITKSSGGTLKFSIDANGHITTVGNVDGVDVSAHDHSGAGQGGTVAFSSIGSPPTTLSGYGITDAAPSSHVGAGGAAHADATESVAGFITAAMVTKLKGIEAAADVTDATNVAAAGALMDGDFTSNGIMKRTGDGTYGIVSAGGIALHLLTTAGGSHGYYLRLDEDIGPYWAAS